MKILITGGAGFIGSHLSELLLQDENTHVTVVDSLSTGTYRNIEHLVAHPRYRLIVAPVTEHAVMEPLVEACDHVYHPVAPLE